jgi:hypothetical protein
MLDGLNNNVDGLKIIGDAQLIVDNTRENIIPVLKIGDIFTEEEFEKLDLVFTNNHFGDARIYKKGEMRFLVDIIKGGRKKYGVHIKSDRFY